MTQHILVIVQATSAHKRIVTRLAQAQVNPHFRSLQELQNWLSEHDSPLAALLDTQWPQYAQASALLARFRVPVTDFRGDFQTADQWMQNYLSDLSPVTASRPTDERQDGLKEESFIPESQDVHNAEPLDSLLPTPEVVAHAPSPSRRVAATNPYRRKTRPVVKQDASMSVPSDVLNPGQESVHTNTPEPSSSHWPDASPAATDSGTGTATIEAPIHPLPPRIVQVPVERVVEVQIPTTVRPRLIVVVQMWPRAGSSFVSMVLADLLAQGLPPGSVSLIEHPSQTPRFWNYFKVEAEKYVHWTEDGRGSVVTVGNVGVVPLPLDYVETEDAKDKTLAYVYRELRRPFVIVDAGPAIDDEPLMEVADDVFLVMDCDLTLIDNRDYAEQYKTLSSKELNLHLVLNKWTKHAAFNDESIKDLFQGSIFLPYLLPEVVQKALWNGDFPTKYPDVAEGVAAIQKQFVSKWIPKELQKSGTTSSRKGLFWRRKDS